MKRSVATPVIRSIQIHSQSKFRTMWLCDEWAHALYTVRPSPASTHLRPYTYRGKQQSEGAQPATNYKQQERWAPMYVCLCTETWIGAPLIVAQRELKNLYAPSRIADPLLQKNIAINQSTNQSISRKPVSSTPAHFNYRRYSQTLIPWFCNIGNPTLDLSRHIYLDVTDIPHIPE
eukprot:GHVU01222708.1.p1 GENE.GHVU01222708.1~~GHVU01222708.1.p1  ORF type:complete len:176 (-),score=2.08 GHVU01222708.1:130-657(-)